jgi:hypothetical protein
MAITITVLAAGAQGETIDFDKELPGTLPAKWIAGVTGRGTPHWTVEADPDAPSAPHVLKQSGSGDFPWCVKKSASLADGFVEVKFKPLSGHEDQAGGLVWRWKDRDNYYVARANALENNVRSTTLMRAAQDHQVRRRAGRAQRLAYLTGRVSRWGDSRPVRRHRLYHSGRQPHSGTGCSWSMDQGRQRNGFR